MKKFQKVVCIILFIMLLLFAVVAATMDLGIEATKHDINLYHLGGLLLLLFPALGFLVETNIFGVKEKTLTKPYHHIILWITLTIIAIICFCICYGLTSKEFQESMNNKNQANKIPYTYTIFDDSKQATEKSQDKLEESINQLFSKYGKNITDETVENSSALDDEPMPAEPTKETNMESESARIEPTIEITVEDESINIEQTIEMTIDDESTDIDGSVFTFNNATYTVNGIEITFHSVTFDKTDRYLNGYQMIFDYSVKNTNNTMATLKFDSSKGQFRCEKGKVILSLSSMNAASNKYESSPVLDTNQTIQKQVMFHAVSNRFAYRSNGIDYEVVEIGDIYTDEPIELDIAMTGWVGEISKSLVITFYLN